jgi:hypothetical protein
MGQEQRRGVGSDARHPYVVDRDVVDEHLVVLELVELRFGRPPVELVCPVLDELSEVRAVGSVAPIGIVEIILEPGRPKSGEEIGKI